MGGHNVKENGSGKYDMSAWMSRLKKRNLRSF